MSCTGAGWRVRSLLAGQPRDLARIQTLADNANHPWVRKIVGHQLSLDQPSTPIISGAGGHWFGDVLSSLWSGGNALLSLVSLLVVAPIVAIYVTIDWDKMITTVDAWISPKHRDEVRALGREINDTVAGFVRGQTVICLILGVFYATVLRSVGLHHGIAIGLIAGLISFVPYLGAGTGFVISMCVAVSQFWPDWTPILVVGGTFFVGEMLADYVLAPRIIGRRVKLNPVWLMFALFAFGALFGFIGLLLAVPLAAAIGVLLRFAIRKSGAQTVKVATPRKSRMRDIGLAVLVRSKETLGEAAAPRTRVHGLGRWGNAVASRQRWSAKGSGAGGRQGDRA